MTRQIVAKASEVAPGTCKIVTVRGREIGIFNLGGDYFALANRCPHAGGPLCRGMITALVQSDGPGHYRLARQNEFIRCPWHGWEFDIRSGQSWCDPNSMKVRQYHITVEPGEQLVKGPFIAETFPVTVEEEYLVLDLAGRPEQPDVAKSA
jgi:3-phenylpropionate/trans-cinnamate dioxygenase ferredoxin subunit